MASSRLMFRSVSLVLAFGLSATAYSQALPADINPDSLARLPYVQRKDTDEGAKRLFDIFVRGSNLPTDQIKGPLAFASYNVPVATALLELHDGAIGGTLDARVRELAILVACRETNYDLEWNGHEPAAVKAGVDAKVIDVVRNRGDLGSVSEADAAVIRFGREMLTDHVMSAATFAKVKELYGDRGAMDMVAVMSTYAVSGFYAIAVNEQAPAGSARLPR